MTSRELLDRVIRDFAPRFLPQGEVLFRQNDSFRRQHGRNTFEGRLIALKSWSPAVIIALPGNSRIAVVDLITAHGIIDEMRRRELEHRFDGAGAPLIFVSALKSRTQLAQGFPAWDTVAWAADEPQHLIHFGPARLFALRSLQKD